jgi:hypothetical protein
MRIRQVFLVATLSVSSALSLAGCGKSPSEPKLSGSDRLYVNVVLNNASGHSTISWVRLLVDNVVEDDSCPAPNIETTYDDNGIPTGTTCDWVDASSVILTAKDRINPGPHTLRLVLLQTPSSGSSLYTVEAFTIEVDDENGKLLKNIDFTTQSFSIAAGQQIYYNFTI